MLVDKYTGRLTGRVPELHPRGSVNYVCGAFLLVFLRPIILICLVHSLYLVYLRILSCVRMHLSVKTDATEKLSGRTSLVITLLWPPRNLSVHVWSGRSPDFDNEKYGVWVGPSLIALIVLLFSSRSFGQ